MTDINKVKIQRLEKLLEKVRNEIDELDRRAENTWALYLAPEIVHQRVWLHSYVKTITEDLHVLNSEEPQVFHEGAKKNKKWSDT